MLKTEKAAPERVDTDAIRKQANLRALVDFGELRQIVKGEWGGPCPKCGGRDRFRIQPDHDGGGRWLCRGCAGGQWQDVIDFVMWRDGVSFLEACAVLGGEVSPAATRPKAAPAVDVGGDAPAAAWQEAALEAVADSCMAMQLGIDWHEEYQHDGRYNLEQRGRLRELTPEAPAAARAYAWLRGRGLTLDTIGGANIGYNAAWRDVLPGVRLAPGIVIPNISGGGTSRRGVLWYLNVRKSKGAGDGGAKYQALKGSALASLYAPGELVGARDVVIVEGEFDALLLAQAAGDLVSVATMGSAGAIPKRWRLALAGCRLFVSLDNDAAGRKGAARWLELGAQAMQPGPAAGEDVTDYWRRVGSDGLRAWVLSSLSAV